MRNSGKGNKKKGKKGGKKGGGCPYNNYVDGECLTPLEIADLATVALFVNFDAETASTLLDPDYIQHNPGAPTGAGGILGFLPALQMCGLGIEIHRSFQDGNLVAYHTTYTNAQLLGGDTVIGFDIYRVEDGLLKEHWDNLQELTGPSPSGNTMTDGATMVTDSRKTERNRNVAVGFVEAVLMGGDFSVVTDFISEDMYIQHNPLIADGLDGLSEGLAAFAEQGVTLVYNSVEIVLAEGNFVLTASDGLLGGVSTAYYDLFRLEDGLIVEHWDVIQTIPPPEEFAHDNGKF